jgi:hypothetical protein
MGRFSDALRAEVSSYADSTWSGELGGQPVTLTATPLTTKDMTALRRQYPDFQVNPSLAGMLDLIMMKARDEAGEKAFDLADKPFLLRVSATKVGEIFGALFGSQFEPEDEQGFEERKKK